MRTRRPAAVPAVVLAMAATLALAACDPGASPGPSGSPSAAPTSSGPASPGPSGSEPSGSLSAADVANIRDAISSGDTAALESYLADPVWYIMPATECCGDISPADAVINLGATGAVGPWDFDLPAATIDGYRASLYADLFPDDVIVGLSANGVLVALGIEDGAIVTIFAGDEELIE